VYLIGVGIERFLIEFLRAKDDRMLGPFTLAQATSVLLLLIGTFVVVRLRAPGDFAVQPVGGLAPTAPPPPPAPPKP
jgi:prolipoprotein diacylglyceryltransferase